MVSPTSAELLLSIVKDRPAVVNVTPKWSPEAVNAVAPEAFAPSPLLAGEALQYAVVKAAMTEQVGNQANSMLPIAGTLQPGKAVHYRFVSLTDGPFMAGISTPSHFKDNFGMPVMCVNGFNGGLVGRGLAKSNFCPKFDKRNTVIDWIMELHSEDRLSVYIAINNKPMGRAYDVSFKENTQLLSTLCPTVCFVDTPEEVTVAMIIYEEAASSEAYKSRRLEVDAEKPYTNAWVPKAGEWEHGFPSPACELHMTDSSISFKVANSIRVGVTVSGTQITPSGPVVSTRMMPPPPYNETEKAVSAFLTSLQWWSVENNVLSLHSGSGGTKHFTLSDPSSDCVQQNPLLEQVGGMMRAL